jgi:hypothetical protein
MTVSVTVTVTVTVMHTDIVSVLFFISAEVVQMCWKNHVSRLAVTYHDTLTQTHKICLFEPTLRRFCVDHGL